jgi:hypothetical protein
MTIFYCLRFETPPAWRARSPYLYPPGTGWPGYTPRHSTSLYGPGTGCTENVSSNIACSLVARKRTCPQSCSLATAAALSPVHMSQYQTQCWALLLRQLPDLCHVQRIQVLLAYGFSSTCVLGMPPLRIWRCCMERLLLLSW